MPGEYIVDKHTPLDMLLFHYLSNIHISFRALSFVSKTNYSLFALQLLINDAISKTYTTKNMKY